MGSSISIINLDELSKPATVLIKKISDAVGGIHKPYQIKRIAKAEVEAEKIRALADIEIKDLQQRALVRFVAEETKKQTNMEAITAKSISDLKDDARPENIEDDWISNFFEKCRLISDREMQGLWAKVLAGEANNPGTYSKRTVNFISSIDKSDAKLFTSLCSYGWFLESIEPNIEPLIYDTGDEIYTKNEITFASLTHLDDIGLISFDYLASSSRGPLPETVKILYHSTPINIKFKNQKNNDFNAGNVHLSKIGQELAPISGGKPVPGFLDYVLKKWTEMELITFSDWPNRAR